MPPSLVSRIVLAGVCSAAAAGWFGVRLSGPGEGQVIQAAPIDRPADSSAAAAPEGEAAQPSVRNRAAWQPSPVPSQATQAGRTQVLPPLNGTGTGAGAVVVPSLPSTGPGATGAVAPASQTPLIGAPGTTSATGPAGGAFLPYTQLFTADRLEAAFDGGLPAERGEWREERFFSRALNREEAYMAWLPPGYVGNDDKGTYPTLYLLHGVGGLSGFGVEEWLGYGLTEDLDRLLALRLIEPMIVILPSGEQGYWMNHADGGPQWADFVAVDLVKHVDATFRTDPRREKRAVGGLSMGGHGSLQLALNFPEVFAIAGAHSPTVRTFEDSPEFFGDQKWFAHYDPLSLIKSSDAAKRIAFWVDAGFEDTWRPGAESIALALAAKSAPVTYKVLEGEHEGWYWEFYLPEYLSFYSQAMHASSKTPQGAPGVSAHLLGPILNTTGMVAASAAVPETH